MSETYPLPPEGRFASFDADCVTVEWVRSRLAVIHEYRADDETAHSYEDALRETVLSAIAEGRCNDPAACAAEALKSNDIRFFRWCA